MTTKISYSPVGAARQELATISQALMTVATQLEPGSDTAKMAQTRLAKIQEMDHSLVKLYDENPSWKAQDTLARLMESAHSAPGLNTVKPSFASLEPESTEAHQAQRQIDLLTQLSALEPGSPQAQILQQRLQVLNTLNSPASNSPQPSSRFNAAW